MKLTRIPCDHDHRNYLSKPTLLQIQRVVVEIKYRVFEGCIFRLVDEDTQIVTTPYYPSNGGSVTSLRINPYCPDCKVSLNMLFVSMDYSQEQCSSLLDSIRGDIALIVSDCSCHPEGDTFFCSYHVEFYRRYVRDYDEATVRDWVERFGSLEAEVGLTSTPASDEAIQALERIVVIPSQETATTAITCAICLEDLMKNEDDVGRRLPCKHEFHEDCIFKWLRVSHYCPLCRFQLPTLLSMANQPS